MAPDGAAIGCYPKEGQALEATIRGTLRESGVAIDADALSWLAGQLGADRAATRAELEKLALYAGPGRRVDLDAAMACTGSLVTSTRPTTRCGFPARPARWYVKGVSKA